MNALEVRDLSVEAGGMTVVRDLDLSVASGDKVGVVGRNGAGKTSTLRVLAGEMPPESGTVERRGAFGYLRQDPRQHRDDDATSGIEYLLGARGLVELQRGVEKARLRLEEHASEDRVSRFTRLQEEYERLGGYRAESDARTIVAGLGLSQDRLGLPVGALSGGERRRLELARILFGGSDLLLFDEPTNHLDADAKGWLMRFLAGVPRGAPRREPRHRAARRLDHADPAPGPGRGRRVPRHVFAVPRGEGPRREAAHGRSPPARRPRSGG